MKTLRRTLFGNPILRQVARRLEPTEIMYDTIQMLIADMRHTLATKQYGVGLAAPQVGHSIALSVIGIHPTTNRPEAPTIDLVVINPEIIKTYGRRQQLWEGCLSFGSGRDAPFAQAQRYAKIRVRYLDEQGKLHEKDVTGLLAHVLQHEIDHLNGILFVDRVTNSKSFVTMSEYRKRLQPQSSPHRSA